MEKINPWNHFNPSILQNPQSTKQIKILSNSSSSLSVAAETSVSFESSSPSALSNRSSFGNFRELNSMNSIKVKHAQIIKKSNEKKDSEIQSLIESCLKLGDFRRASMIFFVDFSQNYLHWNSFLDEFKRFRGNPNEILEVFVELHQKGVSFDGRIIAVVLKICAILKEVYLGLELHAYLIKKGFDSDVHLKCALMNFYGRCWGIKSANQVFDETPEREALLWNEAILVNFRNQQWLQTLQLFQDMQFLLLKANIFTVSKVLQACSKLDAIDEGKQIHGYVIRFRLDSNSNVCNSLIEMYSKTKNLEQARAVFDSMNDRNLSCWNSIISCYAGFGLMNDAWSLFDEMEASGIKPDSKTWNSLLLGHVLDKSYEEVLNILQKMQISGFNPSLSSLTNVLQAIIELRFLKSGKEIHGFSLRNGFEKDLYIATSLIDMYVKNDDLNSARSVFDCMDERNVFAWNSLISGYSFKGCLDEALKLLKQMEIEGVKPDLVTYNSLISGFSMFGNFKEALSVIRLMKKLGLNPNVITWTALISGCSQIGNFKEAIEFSIAMVREGVKPNSNTVSSLLKACTGLSLLQKGKEMHCLSIRNGFAKDAFVSTSLIDMYAKCGDLESAKRVFRKIEKKTLSSWNVMMMGFSLFALGKETISLFGEMRKTGIEPDKITFIALLSGCKQSGLIDQGWKFFDRMKRDYNISPTIEHYSCMVDLLGKSGYIDEAFDLIQTLPYEADATIWGALLGACQKHQNLELAEIASEKLFKIEPFNPANYVLMINLYSSLNKWVEAERIKEMMDVLGVKNGIVSSWIQIDQTVHIFSASGKPHHDEGEIYFELYQLVSEIEDFGYKPDLNCVYQNVSEGEKVKALFGHTEKLAITYGLIRTERRTTIRVVKNTRICLDCHNAAKYISLARNREILLKDGARFHRFRDGKCSCNDYW